MGIFSNKKNPIRQNFELSDKEEIEKLIERHNLHEINEEEILNNNIQDKVDFYDGKILLAIHIPKYDLEKDRYISNLIYFILSKKEIITISHHPIKSIQDFYDHYLNNYKNSQEFKDIISYNIFYKIIDMLYDRGINNLKIFSKDIDSFEECLFSSKRLNTKILSKLLIKRRNIIYLNSIFATHSDILIELKEHLGIMFGKESQIYIEDLEHKLDKIIHTIRMIKENTRSLSTIYNALANIQTNSVISLLTIFTATIGILAMITGLYGMNVNLPGQDDPNMFFVIVGFMLSLLIVLLFFSKHKDRR